MNLGEAEISLKNRTQKAKTELIIFHKKSNQRMF